MQEAFQQPDDAGHLETLETIDEPAKAALDDLTRLAAHICETPISLISVADRRRQRVKSSVGWPLTETASEISFSSHAIGSTELFVVSDAAQDARFHEDPLVTGDPYIRFYAGVPLRTADGQEAGTLCVMDRVSRRLSSEQREGLLALGRQAVAQLELYRQTRRLDSAEKQQAEKAFRETHAQLQTALEMAKTGVWRLDFQTDRWRTIQGGGPVSGVPESESPRTVAAFMKLVHPDDVQFVAETVERARAGADFEIEFRIVLPDRNIRWVAARVQCIRNADGIPTGLMGVDSDITERRQAGQRIDHLSRVYAVLSEINQTIMRVRDPRTMLSYACRIAVEKGGFRMSWIGLWNTAQQRFEITAHAGATEDTLEVLRSIFSGEPGAIDCAFTSHARQSGSHGICNDILHDPRAESWRRVALERGYRSMASLPLKRGETVVGTFNLYAGESGFFDAEELRLLDELARDVAFALEVYDKDTERHRAEHALRESEQRFRQLAENINEVFWIFDPAGNRVLYVSPAYERIWGRPAVSLSESPYAWQDGIHPDDLTRVKAALERRLTEHGYDETYRIRRPDGSVRWIHDRSFPVRGPMGEVIQLVGIAEDITEQRRLEEQFRQSQKMEAIGQLAGGVAHDFNNLLTVILGYSSMLTMTEARPEKTATAARGIVEASERAANLTRQLLTFSRRQVIRPQRLDLNELVINLTKMLHRIVGEDVRLQLNLYPHPLVTRADPGMLDQALMNLVVNARDAMPDGGQLFIETMEATLTGDEPGATPDARPGKHVCLSVTDTGSGISQEDLPHIFEPFFTTKEQGKGTGLGLATVFGIVAQHGGWLQVDSEVNRGTTLRLFLPSEEAAVESVVKEDSVPGLLRGSETLLIVEDDSGVRELTRAMLEHQGYRILEASHGAEALRVWDQHHDSIHLVLTDIVMPEGMSGFELAAQLQKGRPDLRVVFTSGYSEDIAGRQLSLQHGQNFLQKPYSPQELLETVRRCLDT